MVITMHLRKEVITYAQTNEYSPPLWRRLKYKPLLQSRQWCPNLARYIAWKQFLLVNWGLWLSPWVHGDWKGNTTAWCLHINLAFYKSILKYFSFSLQHKSKLWKNSFLCSDGVHCQMVSCWTDWKQQNTWSTSRNISLQGWKWVLSVILTNSQRDNNKQKSSKRSNGTSRIQENGNFCPNHERFWLTVTEPPQKDFLSLLTFENTLKSGTC